VNSYQGDDSSSFGTDPNPLPERCQFMFSDGRQCAMARSDIHPSLCRFHSEREDQLFGSPTAGGHVVGAAFDLPELYSACRDLTTAAGVNRALAQVFRLLAQRRISRQEAATFGHLAHLLLRSISVMRAESTDPTRIGVLSDEPERRTSHIQSPANKRSHPATIGVPSEQREPRDLSVSSPINKSVHPARLAVRTHVESREVMRESRNAESTGLPAPEIGAPLASRTVLRETSPRPSACRSEAPHSESSSPAETGSATATPPPFQHLREARRQLLHNEHLQDDWT
jgi:hypothetical protein